MLCLDVIVRLALWCIFHEKCFIYACGGVLDLDRLAAVVRCLSMLCIDVVVRFGPFGISTRSASDTIVANL